MKRLRVDETVKEGGGSISSTIYRQPISNSSTLSYTTAGSVKVVGEGMQTGLYPSAPSVNYGTMPTAAVTHSGHSQIRGSDSSPPTPQEPVQQQSPGSFHRLKVEDALSYLDLVKFKFNSKPQVYNDFLDIMKEFKSQSIDTPGVIERVSNLFDGFPDLIVGFNTFLPPGYKIEVQKNNDGYAFHVSVSMGNVAGGSDNHHKTSMIMKGSGTINTSVCGQPITHTQQTLPVPSHISPVAPQAPPQQPSIVHHSNSYVPSATTYNSLSLSAAQAAVNQALQGHSETPQNQPVEFNHAINYVNKIKNRFQGQPEKYKRFLEILHTYQKEQRTLKETSGGLGGKQLTEQEVYSQVAKLFENQGDLLAEFGQFLPDATSHMNQVQSAEHHVSKKPPVKPSFRENMVERNVPPKIPIAPSQKRSLSPYSSTRDSHPPKKHKLSSCRDITITEAGKYGTLNDFAFFDKLRKQVKSYEIYENFLRCLTLYNEQIVTRSELILMINPLIGKFPDLMRWFRDFLRQTDVESIPYNVVQNERPKGDLAQEIDFATAKRLGASYCIIPPSQEVRVSSSRTQLCKDVLNDQWVSFPTWSEDSTFVGSRKTQYEEYMYRCEDERFEMDVVIETNASTIRVLENVQKKISRMKPEELANFTLDDTLGGNSAILHQKALKRIYGEKAKDIIEGLKCNPANAIGTILARLKSKELEWREAQKGFNKIWREQNEKYYLKSLDHQGMNFKATDVKALRSKSLFNEIETLYDERHEQNDDAGREVTSGPHIVIPYRDRTILDDATNLLIHNVKRQTAIQKSEKHKIKQFLYRTLPDFFFHPKQHLSDDEEDDKDEDESPSSSPNNNKNSKNTTNSIKSPLRYDSEKVETESDSKEQILPHAQSEDPEEAYTLFMGNNNWYIFLRLHAILCDRLSKIYERSVIVAEEEAKQQPKRKESTALSLRLKPKPHIEIHEYYPAFLDMVKSLLDGNMDVNTYEDTLREMFGIYAYIAFTLDKVVSNAVRQLQHCVTEKSAKACSDLFLSEQKKGSTGGPCVTAHKRAHIELAYQRAAEKAVQDENCFKIFFYKKDCRMTIELLDTENENDGKRVEDTKKWSMYKESYSDCRNTGKIKSPVFLERNLRLYKKRAMKNTCHSRRSAKNHQNLPSATEENCDKANDDVRENSIDEFERELRERTAPERNQTNHPGYHVADDTECKFNSQDSKIVFTSNKDSYIYKISALERAKESHPRITMRLSTRFKYWLKEWVSENVSDSQHKQCIDWLMGRCEGVVPNRTKILTDNDISRPPYTSYNRYKVDQLVKDGT
ncbi:paired amphipathic helix protein Sin3b [Harmonia axyridis]|uniref:paired amphipathic helix protein Sin3b n=1 Tax=Harmonia axyridis TaxID=115357 RepID=UPI001E27733E|nr:paired amphipathic helix protein Sin3b [Harmonia axyridis]XP_045483345.1 paired amphipathic helix protein Sin3b [Harmonia axyridis]